MLKIIIEPAPDGQLQAQLLDDKTQSGHTIHGIDQYTNDPDKVLQIVQDWVVATENLTTRRNL